MFLELTARTAHDGINAGDPLLINWGLVRLIRPTGAGCVVSFGGNEILHVEESYDEILSAMRAITPEWPPIVPIPRCGGNAPRPKRTTT